MNEARPQLFTSQDAFLFLLTTMFFTPPIFRLHVDLFRGSVYIWTANDATRRRIPKTYAKHTENFVLCWVCQAGQLFWAGTASELV